MHVTFGPGDTLFHHNGDFSGNVIIENDDDRIEIPFVDILELVGRYYRDKKFSEIEQMTGTEYLNSLT